MKDDIEWDWTDPNFYREEAKKKQGKKKDPHVEYKKTLIIAFIVFTIGISQLVFVIFSRSFLIWREKKGSSISGSQIINVPPNYLPPNSYVFMVVGYFPTIIYDDVVGSISFVHLNSGKNYSFSYRIVGYLQYEEMIYKVRIWSMKPGKYNVSWINNDDRFEYFLTSRGIFNFAPRIDKYPYISEMIVLIVSIFILVACIIGTIKRYIRAKRDYGFYKV